MDDKELINKVLSVSEEADRMVEDPTYQTSDMAELESLRAENEKLKAQIFELQNQLDESDGFASQLMSTPEHIRASELESELEKMKNQLGEYTKKEQEEAERFVKEMVGEDFVEADKDGKGLEILASLVEGESLLSGRELSSDEIKMLVQKVKSKMGLNTKSVPKGAREIASSGEAGLDLATQFYNKKFGK